MNRLGFEVVDVDTAANQDLTADILIDGVPLRERLKRIELPFAKWEGKPRLAGSYIGRHPEDAFPPSRLFLGESDGEVDQAPYGGAEGRVAVLGCVCGVPACWPFGVRIVLAESTVTWCDFVQPWRVPGAGQPAWDYRFLKPFLFSRRQYEKELNSWRKVRSGAWIRQ